MRRPMVRARQAWLGAPLRTAVALALARKTARLGVSDFSRQALSFSFSLAKKRDSPTAHAAFVAVTSHAAEHQLSDNRALAPLHFSPINFIDYIEAI